MFVVGGFDEFVDQSGGQDVADPVAALVCGGAQCDEQTGLAGSRVTDQAQELAFGDSVAGGQLVNGRGVNVGVGVEIEFAQPFLAWEACGFDSVQGGSARSGRPAGSA
ncbi:hypothetical protein MHEL_31520 [Mycolicibacterium helvum]|uniref:Uncharacterized protein n=1 Tax=Mycolicibacterium helvum TaxID=1534349 RepID=A0A7I7T8W9_9MYCO|nr:hypothetical protein MHEL_31520 [Mycolicibacterium helvum]